MANFRVGQKVVCVDGFSKPWSKWALAEKQIYTVHTSPHSMGGKNFMSVSELQNPMLEGPYWDVNRFRPLISQADDVEMFRRISEDSLGRLEAYEELLNEQFYVDESHQ